MAGPGQPPEPVAIPPQEDFPVEWASPEEAKIPWQHDKMHFPEAMPPLESEFWTRFMHGMHQGMTHYEMPVQVVSKEFNNWVYFGIFPRVPVGGDGKTSQALGRDRHGLGGPPAITLGG
jgi:hypothetical protein